MNKLSSISSIVLAFLIHTACQSPVKQGEKTTGENAQEELKTEQKGITFNDGQLSKNLEFTSGHTDTIGFSVHIPDSVHILVKSPMDTANIRISQLLFPNGTSDGPFGKELLYQFSDTGQYYLMINENKMVGNAYTGPYEVEILPMD